MREGGGRRGAGLKGEAVALLLAPEVRERAHVEARGMEGRGVVGGPVQAHHGGDAQVAQQARVEGRAEAPAGAAGGVAPEVAGGEGAVGGGEEEELAGDEGGDVAVDGAGAGRRRGSGLAGAGAGVAVEVRACLPFCEC